MNKQETEWVRYPRPELAEGRTLWVAAEKPDLQDAPTPFLLRVAVAGDLIAGEEEVVS